MEAAGQVVKDIKRSARYQEELDADIMDLNNKITVENHNLSIAQTKGAQLDLELGNRQKAVESLKEQEVFLGATRDSVKSAIKWRSYITSYISQAAPNDEHLEGKLKSFKERHDSLVSRHEQKPGYRKLVDAETKALELERLIVQKRNELMKLETEKEYN